MKSILIVLVALLPVVSFGGQVYVSVLSDESKNQYDSIARSYLLRELRKVNVKIVPAEELADYNIFLSTSVAFTDRAGSPIGITVCAGVSHRVHNESLMVWNNTVSPDEIEKTIALLVANLDGAYFSVKQEPYFTYGNIIKVIDGDTADIQFIGGMGRVRFVGIDAPELDQPWGVVAREYLEQYKHMEMTVHVRGRDVYGRLLVNLMHTKLGEGVPTGLSTKLVQAGLAWDYNDAWFSELENDARAQKVGLWSQDNPVAPWDWRAGKTNTPPKKVLDVKSE